MVIVDLHYEGNESLEKLIGISPIIISIVPSQVTRFSTKDTETIKRILENPENMLGQQGLTHRCRNRHKTADPYHENMCLYGNSPELTEQLVFMEEGKDLLKGILDKNPELYVPPNHYWNRTTLEAVARIGYYGMTTLNLLGIPAYKERGVLVIPETRSDTQGLLGGNIIYSHCAERDIEQVVELAKEGKLENLREVRHKKVSQFMRTANDLALHTWKLARDSRRYLK